MWPGAASVRQMQTAYGWGFKAPRRQECRPDAILAFRLREAKRRAGLPSVLTAPHHMAYIHTLESAFRFVAKSFGYAQMAEARIAADLFIPSGSRIDASHPEVRRFATASWEDLRRRWESARGVTILQNLMATHFQRETLEQSVGRLYENYDFRGIPLRGADLSRTDLHNIDFYAADLRDAKLVGCNLTNTHFSEADIRGADFSFAQMNDSFLDNAKYDLNTKFVGVDIRYVNFNLAALLQDQARAQQRIAHLKSRSPVLAFLLRCTSNYGQSLVLWSAWVVATIVAFAVIYVSVPGITNGHGVIDAIYFSVTTFATLGLGDITVHSEIGRIVVSIEVIVGYLMGGLFIAILVRRLTVY